MTLHLMSLVVEIIGKILRSLGGNNVLISLGSKVWTFSFVVFFVILDICMESLIISLVGYNLESLILRLTCKQDFPFLPPVLFHTLVLSGLLLYYVWILVGLDEVNVFHVEIEYLEVCHEHSDIPHRHHLKEVSKLTYLQTCRNSYLKQRCLF